MRQITAIENQLSLRELISSYLKKIHEQTGIYTSIAMLVTEEQDQKVSYAYSDSDNPKIRQLIAQIEASRDHKIVSSRIRQREQGRFLTYFTESNLKSQLVKLEQKWLALEGYPLETSSYFAFRLPDYSRVGVFFLFTSNDQATTRMEEEIPVIEKILNEAIQ